mgnify:FL=1
MFIIMNMASISHKVNSPLIIFTLVLKMFFVFEARAQNTQMTEPHVKIQSLTNDFLVPSNKYNCYKEVLRYIVIPSNSEPESALSIQNSGDSTILELIAFKKSISDQIMIQFIENSRNTVFETDTVNYSIAISSELSNKLENLINYLFAAPYRGEKVNEVPLDGTLYSFCVFGNDKTRTLMFHSSQQDILRNKVIKLFSKLSNFVVIGSINEGEAIASIDEIFGK